MRQGGRPHTEVERDPIAEIARLGQALQQLNKTVEDQLGISLVQYHLLRALLEQPATTPQRLASAVGLHPSTLTQSIKRLARKGLLNVCRDPRDSRCKLLAATRTGRDAVAHVRAGIDLLLARVRSEHPLLDDLLARLERPRPRPR